MDQGVTGVQTVFKAMGQDEINEGMSAGVKRRGSRIEPGAVYSEGCYKD